jgi:hypothetical protein
MPSKPEQVSPRSFNPMSIDGIPEEARKAVNAVFDAMATWRTEIANSSGKNSEQVIQKMGEAARALGGPEQIVEVSRTQLQSLTKMQLQIIDQMMDAWEQQMKSPNPIAAPSALLSKLNSFGSTSPAGSWPDANSLKAAASMNPMQFWMQSAEQFQKAWAQALDFWARPGKQQDLGERRR